MEKCMPYEILEHILSYGDPDVTSKFRDNVMKQIKYLSQEFDYLTKCKPGNKYYGQRPERVTRFIIFRNREKMAINKMKVEPTQEYWECMVSGMYGSVLFHNIPEIYYRKQWS